MQKKNCTWENTTANIWISIEPNRIKPVLCVQVFGNNIQNHFIYKQRIKLKRFIYSNGFLLIFKNISTWAYAVESIRCVIRIVLQKKKKFRYAIFHFAFNSKQKFKCNAREQMWINLSIDPSRWLSLLFPKFFWFFLFSKNKIIS